MSAVFSAVPRFLGTNGAPQSSQDWDQLWRFLNFLLKRGISGQNAGIARVLGTAYQNTGSSQLFVSVTLNNDGAALNQAQAFTDENPNPGTVVASVTPSALNEQVQLTFLVLPGNYYEVDAAALSVVNWTEWQ